MKDVRSDDMEALLDFVYHGIVHIPQDNLSSLLKTAEGLQVNYFYCIIVFDGNFTLMFII